MKNKITGVSLTPSPIHNASTSLVPDLTMQTYYNYRKETEHCSTTSTNNTIQGKEITINDGQFTSVGGDYHEHTYVVLKESTKGSKYLKAFQGKS